jgi:hypothetical protein
MIEEYFGTVSGEDDWNPRYNIAPMHASTDHPAEPEATSTGIVAGAVGV